MLLGGNGPWALSKVCQTVQYDGAGPLVKVSDDPVSHNRRHGAPPLRGAPRASFLARFRRAPRRRRSGRQGRPVSDGWPCPCACSTSVDSAVKSGCAPARSVGCQSAELRPRETAFRYGTVAGCRRGDRGHGPRSRVAAFFGLRSDHASHCAPMHKGPFSLDAIWYWGSTLLRPGLIERILVDSQDGKRGAQSGEGPGCRLEERGRRLPPCRTTPT